MNKAKLKKFQQLLEDKRNEIVQRARQTLDQDMTLDADDLPDEMDLASSEHLQSFTFRLPREDVPREDPESSRAHRRRQLR